MDECRCGLPEDDFFHAGTELLKSAERLAAALGRELIGGAMVADTVGERRCIFLVGLYLSEWDTAERLPTLAAGTLP